MKDQQNNFERFQKIVKSPLQYKLFLLSKLPMAWVAGLKIVELDQEKASVVVGYKWINQNPFQSIYFAVLGMAAELSTGVICFANIYQRKPSMSILIVNLQANFHKKATGKIKFTCKDGMKIQQAIDAAYSSKESQVIQCSSTGLNENNEVVADFVFTWSMKVKN